MQQGIPAEDEVLSYFTTLSNWGRWGQDDQLGTLNLITPEKTRRAISLVHEGVTLSCARTIRYEAAPDVPAPPIHYMVESGEGWASGQKVTTRVSQASVDFFGMVFHGFAITHIDSLAHFFWEGKMYNGRPAHLVSTSQGATVESVEVAKDGIITRAVLVDVPMLRDIDWVERGEGVMPQDIEEAERRCGFQVEEGDILLVRTGQLKRRQQQGPVDMTVAGSTACQAACLPLFHQRGIAMIGSDTGNDVAPRQYQRLANPIHQVGIVAMGLWILDNADLEGLAEACRQRQRWECMLCLGPLRLYNATGSPINPLAVF
ncbi:MAG TPA: cyclase family protein [Candidatus Tectomicrobia bacterium]